MSTSSTLGLHASPSTKLAIIPLLSTTAGLFYALVEPTIFIPFLRASTTAPTQTSTTVRLWWTHFLPLGLTTIFSIGATTLVSGIRLLRSDTLAKGSVEWKVAVAGVGFGVGHFLFVPKIAATIADTVSEEVEKRGETIDTVRTWLRVHAWRTVLMDVPAWACFAWLVFRQEGL